MCVTQLRNFITNFIQFLIGVVGNTLVSHTGTPGSIPGWGALFKLN
ncbi:hypothetical protein DDB_G0293096 [Dictyostelium discoideum AX4]|uniref:Uncharacterized protein n=1 Tax=Dictyostelium discoideum TaxID=44689 RepID=Q54CA0_DICDI|nr:hypothetical protein DDB_G0293096 [Dictyostelium discoideum AX4]EAL60900.1 hypothetical protein DDB_G0293096 [Dictyostelium discoideum AX4]|eukprot:XP_629319.1 hypothetical protein DDB_G0293096 [Dictyostelium discoideum AX4]